MHSTGESGQRIGTGPCLIWVDVENPFRAEWLFKPRLIQATARLDRQLLSEETQIIFAKEHLRDARQGNVYQIPGRTMVDKRLGALLGEATADEIGPKQY